MRFIDHYSQNIQGLEDFLIEFTIKDYSKVVPSKRNREWLRKRQQEGFTGSTLQSLQWKIKKDTILLKYKVKPTPTEPTKKISKAGKSSSTKNYEAELLFEEVSKYLGTKKDFKSQTKGTQIKRVRDMIKNATVKVHSNAPDFFFQGAWRRASDADYNIYPIPTKKDKGIWKARNDNKDEYITKHLIEVVRTVPFLADTIAKLIREK